MQGHRPAQPGATAMYVITTQQCVQMYRAGFMNVLNHSKCYCECKNNHVSFEKVFLLLNFSTFCQVPATNRKRCDDTIETQLGSVVKIAKECPKASSYYMFHIFVIYCEFWSKQNSQHVCTHKWHSPQTYRKRQRINLYLLELVSGGTAILDQSPQLHSEIFLVASACLIYYNSLNPKLIFNVLFFSATIMHEAMIQDI